MNRIIYVVDQYINRLLKILVILLLAVMSAVVFAQVVFRFFHASIVWSEEISIYMMVWCTFLGAALCCRKGAMIGLDAVRTLLPIKIRTVVIVFAGIITAVFLLILAYVGGEISAKMWMQTTPILKLPMGSIYAAIPTGTTLMAINTLLCTYENLKGAEK